MRARIAFVLLLASAVLTLAGCGRDADKARIRRTVTMFLHAYARGDAHRSCTFVTARGRRTLFRSATVAECERRVEKQLEFVRRSRLRQLRTATLGGVYFDDATHAHVYVRFRNEFNTPDAPLELVERGERWLIAGPPPGS
jgi:hypothetical protein